jgi:hypothetical protein
LLLLLTAWRVRLTTALPAASALIASASSVVPVISIALLSTTASATALTALTAFVALLLTALVTATRLRIVGLLLLGGGAGIAVFIW